mmetsp:Transcript_23249/g.26365  ORF Transcript_23249/g.26365 Transcript_23249/m.26365 type:complete len:262 (+) Transcript_23249:384-1169(+)|eukprot:CAMPEP_0114988848 /NCGR_PEP_ID=MMETSP0216-20121206/9848_1 /TAXON_ID=223996 /ORGANISM="Protocruzia adherens, Strain Boccale" /LENGTH=261 /DNA_ID=CAMNT_0002351717 /DNA_START=336 /DNA_END=1121 /DNA_ORIENTATION=+
MSSADSSTTMPTDVGIASLQDVHIKLFECPIPGCSATYTRMSTLRRHLASHNNVKRHKCETCGKRFTLRQNLKDHIRIHTGEKPFACDVPGCTKRYRQRGQLSIHKKTHRRKEGKTEEDTAPKGGIFAVMQNWGTSAAGQEIDEDESSSPLREEEMTTDCAVVVQNDSFQPSSPQSNSPIRSTVTPTGGREQNSKELFEVIVGCYEDLVRDYVREWDLPDYFDWKRMPVPRQLMTILPSSQMKYDSQSGIYVAEKQLLTLG